MQGNLFNPLPLAVPEPLGLPPLPKPLRTDQKVRWLGDDGKNVFIEVQGQFAAVAIRKGPLKYQRRKRNEIRGFSAASRLRLFKKINRLDFNRAGRSTFLTGTWIDALGRPDPAEITVSRSRWQRSVEEIAGRHVCGIWRVEWEIRKSGTLKGEYMPHCHIIYFNCPYLDKELITAEWAKAIGWDDWVSVKVKEIVNLRQCLYYVSKYIAKLDQSGNLDIPSYLNKHMAGRKWGIYRQHLLPLADSVLIRVENCALVKKIREIATKTYEKTSQEDDEGFCVFGSAAAEIEALVNEYCLKSAEKNVDLTTQGVEEATPDENCNVQ